jgi:acyl-CoA synthetase (AMP-forming)/AMP-acid ligase II
LDCSKPATCLESCLVAEGRASCFDLFEQSAKLHPQHEAIWSRERAYTWEQSYRSVCQYAHYLQGKGVIAGDFVALYLMNRPEFMFCWLGLLAIGASPALVNYNLASKSLLHCIQVSGSHLMIVDDEDSCVRRVREVQKVLDDASVEVVFMGGDMKSIVSSMPATPPPRSLRQKKTPLGLLYTRYDLCVHPLD